MTLYEKLLLLTYYNPRIIMYKYDRYENNIKVPEIYIRTPPYRISIITKKTKYTFIDSLNILTEKDFKQLVKCL